MPGRPPLTADQFAALLDVSRETLDRLLLYEALLRRWQRTINLVGERSLADVWRRHFLDCGQLIRYLGDAGSVVDIGSGGGFPGLVIAILADRPVTLVEADHRKAAFLREVARRTGAPAEVIVGRAESVSPKPADVVTARAVAPIGELLALARPWLRPGGRCLFLKGATVTDELTDAARIWNISYELHPSLSAPDGKIVSITEFARV